MFSTLGKLLALPTLFACLLTRMELFVQHCITKKLTWITKILCTKIVIWIPNSCTCISCLLGLISVIIASRQFYTFCLFIRTKRQLKSLSKSALCSAHEMKSFKLLHVFELHSNCVHNFYELTSFNSIYITFCLILGTGKAEQCYLPTHIPSSLCKRVLVLNKVQKKIKICQMIKIVRQFDCVGLSVYLCSHIFKKKRFFLWLVAHLVCWYSV